MTAIVTLTRFTEIFDRLRKSVDIYEPEAVKVVVTSGEGRQWWRPQGWTVVPGIEPFIFARNANLALRGLPGEDVLLVNDDCELTMPILETLRATAATYPQVGLLSPHIAGGPQAADNAVQTTPRWDSVVFSERRLAFVCIFIPARTRARVGLLDEDFDGYGGDDVDYSFRVQQAGLKLGVVPSAVIHHGYGGHQFSSSFLRVMSKQEKDRQGLAMNERFRLKHGLTQAEAERRW